MATLAPSDFHRGPIGGAFVCNHDMRIPISSHCFLQEFQSCDFVAVLDDAGFQDSAFTIHGSPEAMLLAADFGYACLRLTKTSSTYNCDYGLRCIESDRRFGATAEIG